MEFVSKTQTVGYYCSEQDLEQASEQAIENIYLFLVPKADLFSKNISLSKGITRIPLERELLEWKQRHITNWEYWGEAKKLKISSLDAFPILDSKSFPWYSCQQTSENKEEESIGKELQGMGLISYSGLKFGGDVAVYKDLPWKTHSVSILLRKEYEEEIEMYNLISHCRMSCHVGKRFCLVAATKAGKNRYYSFSHSSTRR